MNKLYYIIICITLFCCTNTFAQSGTIKYWSINENIDYKKEFTLTFNRNESFLVYDLKPFSFKTKQGFTVNSPGQYSAVYMDTKSKEAVLYKRKHRGQLLKAKFDLQSKKWTIHKEFKTIAGYKVQKATLSYNYSPKTSEPSGMGNIEVWFAPKIPVNAGPNVLDGNLDFVQWGLPGLILEVSYVATAWKVKAFDIQLSKTPIAFPIPKEKTKEVSYDKFWY